MAVEDKIAIIVKYSAENCKAIQCIRNKVFTEEEGIDENADFDGQDKDAIHVLVKADDQYVGTGRMLNDGHIGRLAVQAQWRGKGYGRRLLNALIDQAKKQGLKRVYLGAQWDSIGFYEKSGFEKVSNPFMEAGIKHIIMEKWL